MRSYGFTLLEMVVILAVVVILLGVATPNVLLQLKKQEVRLTQDKIRSFLQEGKQDSLILQQDVTLCVADVQLNCVRQHGTLLLSFLDRNRNNRFDRLHDVLLHQYPVNLRFGYLVSHVGLRRTFFRIRAGSGKPIAFMGSIHYCAWDFDPRFMFKVSFNMMGLISFKHHSLEPVVCA